jgi:hypothetical protein
VEALTKQNGVRLLGKLKKKIKKIKKIALCISFFGTVFRKHCTVLSQSELRNFAMYIISGKKLQNFRAISWEMMKI